MASLAAVAIFSTIAYFFSKPLVDFLLLPLRLLGSDYTLYFHSPYEAFLIRLKASVAAGVVGAVPFFLVETWLFVSPGLHQEERRIALVLSLVSLLFFVLGAVFALWVLAPLALKFFLGFQTDAIRPLLGAGSYFSFLLGMVLASGILFDLPIVLLGLIRLGILETQTLRRYRKIVIVSLLILAALLTPSGDPASQLLLALPLLLLYEACVGAGRWIEPKRKSE